MLSKNMLEKGLLFLKEQKAQGGRLNEWKYEINKSTARKYAFELKALAKKKGIDLDEYIHGNGTVDELYEKVKNNTPVVAEKSENAPLVNKVDTIGDEKSVENVQEEVENQKPVEKESEKVIEKSVREKKGAEIIKRNVMRSHESARLFREEKKEKSVPLEKTPEETPKIGFKLNLPVVLLIAGGVGIALLIFFLLKSRNPQRSVNMVSPVGQTQNQPVVSGENELLSDDTIESIYTKMGYKLWRP